jgi:NAD+ kinase
LLPRAARVHSEALETDKRPVSAVADFTEVRRNVSVDIRENRDIAMTLLFDRDANLEERVFKEQFMT